MADPGMSRKVVAAAGPRLVCSALAVLQVFGFSCEGLAPISSRLIKFSQGLSWNNARAVCQQNGWDLMQMDPFNTEFLLQEKKRNPSDFNDNIWIGLYDVAQESSSIGKHGFKWVGSCNSLEQPTKWDNWKDGEPAARWNNWCVRLQYGTEFEWFAEQCSTPCHYLCQVSRETPCETFKDSTGCDLSSPDTLGLTKVSSKFQSESECKKACVAYTGSEANVTCWMVTLTAKNECLLYVGTSPVPCTGSQGATLGVWIRDCYSLVHNNTKISGLTGAQTNPNASCDSSVSTAIQSETTSAAEEPVTTTSHTTTQPTTATTTTPPTTATTTPPTTTVITAAVVTTVSETTTATKRAQTTPTTTTATQTTTRETVSTSIMPLPTTASAAGPVKTMFTEQTTSTVAEVTTLTTEPRTSLLTRLASTAAVTEAARTTLPSGPPPTADSGAGFLGMTTMAIDISTAVNLKATTGTQCWCKCNQQKNTTMIDIVNAQKVTQQLKKELTLDTSTLSSTRRRKTSAEDERPSAKATGALGIVIIVGTFCLIVLPDIKAIYQAARFGPYH